MNLSYRLKKIIDFVPHNCIVADIGTDHAYIPIYLIKNNISLKVIACDVSANCVKKAIQNVSIHNLQNYIDVRISNGLEKLTVQDNINTIIISGMGGMLTIDILKAYPNIFKTVDYLILQPQKDIEQVRRFLHLSNFYIEKEDFFVEHNKFYNIILAKNKFENFNQNFSDIDYIFGQYNLHYKNIYLKEYILHELSIMENVIKNLNCENTNFYNLNQKIFIYKEALNCF